MGTVRVLSTDTIKATKSSDQTIHLTPWDLRSLLIPTNKKGLFYHHPVVSNQIQRLRHSLSSTLAFFQPLAGRLKITEYQDKTVSCSVICNNAGVLFVHARSENTCVADILEPTYVPPIVDSFFALTDVRSYEGTSKPLLAVQVTELIDGIFIGCSFNHAVIDGKSVWHFINSWAEISRSCCHHQISKPPTLERWFPDGVQRPIRFPFTLEQQKNHSDGLSFLSLDDEKLCFSNRIFHFTKEKIVQLKLKINEEIGTIKISSLQAPLTHLWCCVMCSKKIDPQEEVVNRIVIGVGPRLVPPLPEYYFGNAVISCMVKMTAGELLKEGGLCKGACEMNKLIALHTDEKLKNHYESWLRNPSFSNMPKKNFIAISSSPWFDVYGNDFGWGKPVAGRGGYKANGLITVFAGIEEGSIDLQVCLPYEILEAMGNDPQFMDVASN
ncbi:putative transferase [Medicago truncatula]|uniref:HXXXD-type acyl-transferase family protein n=1 Tax=Medicago truncatula TaxID=3880 RepID=G7L135_MEDTR|nr:protein ENHANCED PSEUDOMONAS SUSCEPTIBILITY 1 [Medicago truncatula]AES78285.1 HXXXD-type acyl-transferase family protein [Medicago truncatula]RHN44876.1 putative transferase [Medicago truncatula]